MDRITASDSLSRAFARIPQDLLGPVRLIGLEDVAGRGHALVQHDLQSPLIAHVVTLDPEVDEFGSTGDVIENPLGFEFVPLVAQHIATRLRDAGAGVTYQSQAVKAGIPQDSVPATELEFVHEPEFLP